MESQDVALIRQTIHDCIAPVAKDVANVSVQVNRLADEQALIRSEIKTSYYTREYLDLAMGKLKEDHENLHKDVTDLKSAVGSLWHQTALKVGLVLTILIQIATLWRLFAP